MAKSPYLALGADVDHVGLARLLRRAHTIAVDTGVAPTMVRRVVSDSWRRSAEAGVDPANPAPRAFDAHRTAERLARHPIAPVLPKVRELLKDALAESGCFAAFSDADGVLLWTEGPADALRTAVTPRFLPGFMCGEDRIGTNAIGTALVLDHPVQVFSAEHFNHLLHGWICAAAPVHDPETGELLGAIDVSGGFRTAHVHGLALATAVARATEGWLAADRHLAATSLVRRYRSRNGSHVQSFRAVVASSGRVLLADPPGWLGTHVDVPPGSDGWALPDGTPIEAQQLGDGYLISRPGPPHRGTARPRVMVRLLGRDRPWIAVDGRRVDLRPRHGEILALLVLNPEGMTVRELACELYGAEQRQSTVRSEITRLRRLVGEALHARPYRLDPSVKVDLSRVQHPLAEGDLATARRHYTGPLLPRSSAPGVVAARDELLRALEPPS